MGKLTLDSKIKEIYATPIGHDVVGKLLMQMGKGEELIRNPIVGNRKLGTIAKLTGKKLGIGFFNTLLTLLNTEQDTPIQGSGSITPKWWKEAVFYQIYPRTFRDTNGDGIGDIPGIIEKLDYLQELGVNALWLSPVYDSPNDDNGYDIRDYHKIMQEFGTMEDFDRLLEGAHARGMHLIMDLVVNHTSDEHAWFRQALADEHSKYRDYYFLKTGEEKPNNWTSFFSGSAWNYYEKEKVWGLHLFSKKQMDLNWENEEVRDEIATMVNWWLDKGVDGFRMDVINYISKAAGLPQGDDLVGQLMGYTGIEHYFYGPRLHEFLRELRAKAFEPHQAFSVGETPGLGMRMCQLVTGEERKELDMVFSFDHLETPGHVRFDDYAYDLNYYRDYMIDWMEHYGNNCWMSLFYNNHDNPKMISKINPDGQYTGALAKLLAVMQFTLKGTPFIYQGDEMGLTNHAFQSMEEITDVESKGMYEELRKTMSHEEAFAKILAGTREHGRLLLPWEDREDSWEQPKQQEIYPFYQKLIRMRKEHTVSLVYGEFRVLSKEKDRFVFERSNSQESFVIDCNLSVKECRKYHNPSDYQEILSTQKDVNTHTLNAYETVISMAKNV